MIIIVLRVKITQKRIKKPKPTARYDTSPGIGSGT